MNGRGNTERKVSTTLKTERQVYNILKEDKKQLTSEKRRKLTPHHNKPPHLYGLPKTFKSDHPLRQITS